MRATNEARHAGRWLFVGLAATIVAGVARASALTWLSDSAFVGFRYAANFARGEGLVLNAGERVDGLDGVLWPLLVGLAMRLVPNAEAIALVVGLAAWLGTLICLAVAHRRARGGLPVVWWALPFAPLAAVAHRDLAAFATSGLDTSLSTFVLTLATLLLVDCERPLAPAREPAGRLASSGALFAVAGLLRWEAAALVLLPLAAFANERRSRAVVAIAMGFVATWLPATIAHRIYYRAGIPLPWHAVALSATNLRHGVLYVFAYYARCWPLVLAWPLLWMLPRRARWLLLGIPAAHALGVVAMGGATSQARALVSTTPLLLLALDRIWLSQARRWPRAAAALGALVLALVAFARPVMSGPHRFDGIVDEHDLFTIERVNYDEFRASMVSPLWAGLPARVAFGNEEARFVYVGAIPYAIDAELGSAHRGANERQGARGRSDFAKERFDYLVRQRGAQLAFGHTLVQRLELDDRIPQVHANFRGIPARMLRWDPALAAGLRARGIGVDDYPELLDALIARLPFMTREEIERERRLAQAFYFDWCDDPRRAAAFDVALGGPIP